MDNETKAVLDWLDAWCEQADAAAKRGDVGMLNAAGHGITTYYNNVYKLRSMPREAFPHWHPGAFTEASIIKAQYDALEQTVRQGERISALENKLNVLAEMIEKLVEANAGPEPKKAARRGKKSLAEDTTDTKDEPDAATEQDEEEENPPAETDAEEADATEEAK